MSEPAARWLFRAYPRPRALLTLICFHHAGGDAIEFRSWQERLPETVEVCAVSLPGHQNRYAEPLLHDVHRMAAAIGAAVTADDGRPFAFFGHSMGAVVAFETARWLRRAGARGPVSLIVAGHRAPQLAPLDVTPLNATPLNATPADATPLDVTPFGVPVHALPDGAFIDAIMRINGTPAEVFAHPGMTALVLPILRADMTAAETYAYRPDEPLDTPIAALAGADDQIAPAIDMAGWARQTTVGFTLDTLPGGHFFVRESSAALMSRLAALLPLPRD